VKESPKIALVSSPAAGFVSKTNFFTRSCPHI
jgi:hypothetical protein